MQFHKRQASGRQMKQLTAADPIPSHCREVRGRPLSRTHVRTPRLGHAVNDMGKMTIGQIDREQPETENRPCRPGIGKGRGMDRASQGPLHAIASPRLDAEAGRVIRGLTRAAMVTLAVALLTGCASSGWSGAAFGRNEAPPEIVHPKLSLATARVEQERDIAIGQAVVSPVSETRPAVPRLPDLIAEGLDRNPGIRAVRERWRAAEAQIGPAGSFDDPVVSYTNFARSVETRVGPQRNRFGVSQKFPFFGKLSLKEEIAARAAEAVKQQYEARKLDVVARVKSAYYSLFLAYKSIDITEANVELLRRFADVANVRYATGKTSQQDVLKAQLRLSRLANQLVTLRQDKKTAEAALNVLLDRPPNAPLGRPADIRRRRFDNKLEDLRTLALDRQPRLLARKATIRETRAALALAKRNYYPDFALGLDYIDVGGGTTTSPADGKDALMLTVRVNVPLWVDRRNSRVAATRAAVRSAEASHDATRNDIFFDIQDGLVKVQTAERLVDLFTDTLLPQAEQTLQASLVGYEADKVDFLNLLDSQRVLHDLQLDYYRVLVEFEQRLANLEKAVGVELGQP